MTAPEAQVREQILQAAARLTGEGLIERTWGNISARVSDTQFLITPSGPAGAGKYRGRLLGGGHQALQ